MIIISREYVAKIYLSKVWTKLSQAYRYRLYRKSISQLTGGLDERLVGIIDSELIREFVHIFKEDKFSSHLVMTSYGEIYFESKCFGLRNNYIETFLSRRAVNVSIIGSLIGRLPCLCCGYCVFLPVDSALYAECPVCYWMNDTFKGHSLMNGKSLVEGQANFKAYGTSDLRYKKTCLKVDNIYFHSADLN